MKKRRLKDAVRKTYPQKKGKLKNLIKKLKS